MQRNPARRKIASNSSGSFFSVGAVGLNSRCVSLKTLKLVFRIMEFKDKISKSDLIMGAVEISIVCVSGIFQFGVVFFINLSTNGFPKINSLISKS